MSGRGREARAYQGLVVEQLELAALDVALAVRDEGDDRLLRDVLLLAIGGRAGAVGGVVAVLLELGPLERRRVGHVERGGGRVEDRTRGWAAKRSACLSPARTHTTRHTQPVSRSQRSAMASLGLRLQAGSLALKSG